MDNEKFKKFVGKCLNKNDTVKKTWEQRLEEVRKAQNKNV